jgi:hypothetical protein
MVDIVITVANVDWVSGPKESRDASETITAGDCVYAVSSTTLGVCDRTDAAKDVCVGIALNDGTTGHPIVYAKSGAVVGFGAILTAGLEYCVSDAGGISLVADLASNDYASYLGHALTTSNLQLVIKNTAIMIV